MARLNVGMIKLRTAVSKTNSALQSVSDAFADRFESLADDVSQIDEILSNDEKWTSWRRERVFREQTILTSIQAWVVERLLPYLEKIDEDMERDGFDPQKKEHFAVIQALVSMVPSTASDMAKLFEMTAKYFGHFQDHAGTAIILPSDIQAAVVALSKKVPPRAIEQ